MRTGGRVLIGLLCAGFIVGCASNGVEQSDARRPKKIDQSTIRLADRDYLHLCAHLVPYSRGPGARWSVRMYTQDSPGSLMGRWTADLGEIEESRPLEAYDVDVKVGTDRIATFTPWNNTSTLIDRNDGWISQRDGGKRLFDRASGTPETLSVFFSPGQSGGSSQSASQPAGSGL
ncbi:MAG: hypothetical protein H7Z14_20510 [Anaerolineae bacterium]|nr:hypothetical protein [Phycisphaerae bacterium]